MDIINDLGNDLALAFLVEKKHGQKIGSQDVLALIRRIKAALHRVDGRQVNSVETFEIEHPVRQSSH